MKKLTKLLIIPVFLLLIQGCVFKSSSFIGVMSYRNNKVYLQNKKFYNVGELPEGWSRIKASSTAISFYNKDYNSSITTDAFCGRTFVDRPLDALAGELIAALKDRTTISTKKFMLDERGALRVFTKGTLDGINVCMDIVVVKKNGCNFDFIAVTPVDKKDEVIFDFERFFNAFHY